MSSVAFAIPCAAQAADGDIDASFGANGRARVTVAAGDNESASDVAVDGQGRVVLAGTLFASDQYAIVRLTAAGVPDPSFSGDGVKILNPLGTNDEVGGVAVDAQGGILVAGTSSDDFATVRLLDNGEQDMSFGTAGVARTNFGNDDEATSIAIDPEGRIVVAGSALIGGDDDFGVARYSSTGQPDTSFSIDGRAPANFTGLPNGPQDDTATAIAFDSQGRVVLGGYTHPQVAGVFHFAVARFTDAGVLDDGFDTDGKATTPLASKDFISGVAVDAQNRIVAGGVVADGDNAAAPEQFAIARYTDSGGLDPTFAGDGVLTTSVGTFHDRIWDLAIDPNGRIIVGGSTGKNGEAAIDPTVVARYDSNGAPDLSFGTAGKVVVPDVEATSLALGPRGRIFIGGNIGAGVGNNDFGALSILDDGTAPTASIDSGPKDGSSTKQTKPEFGIGSSEPGSTFSCGFDGPAGPCSSPAAPGGALGDGEHTFTLVATDSAGNASAPLTRTFTVDTKKPKVKIKGDTSVGAGAKVALKLKTSEPAKLKCKLDKSKAKKCGKKFKAKLDAGSHKLKVTATDQAGNKGKAKAKLVAG